MVTMAAESATAQHALEALEARAIREKQCVTYSTSLGSGSFFVFVVFGLALPSPWKVLNGEWSSSILPSLLALGGTITRRLLCSCVRLLSIVQGDSTCVLLWWSDAFLRVCYVSTAQGVWMLSAILALKCAQVQGEELLREFSDKVHTSHTEPAVYIVLFFDIVY